MRWFNYVVLLRQNFFQHNLCFSNVHSNVLQCSIGKIWMLCDWSIYTNPTIGKSFTDKNIFVDKWSLRNLRQNWVWKICVSYNKIYFAGKIYKYDFKGIAWIFECKWCIWTKLYPLLTKYYAFITVKTADFEREFRCLNLIKENILNTRLWIHILSIILTINLEAPKNGLFNFQNTIIKWANMKREKI